MDINEVPYWLLNAVIIGRENDDDNDGDGEDGDDEGNDGEDNDSEDGEDGSQDDADKPDEETARLKEALRKERKLRRDAQREAKQLKQGKQTEEDSKASEEAQKRVEASEAKTAKLAAKLLNKEISDAVLAEARRLKFIDPTDALTDAVLKEVDAHQDEDDPSDIDIDTDSVKDAVKALADSKKHLIAKPNDGDPSGTKFSGKGGKKDSDATKEKLLADYPSLR